MLSFFSGGLSCQSNESAQVVMVHESVADDLVALLKVAVSKLTVGAPEDDCDVCHVISSSSADWIEELVTGAPSPLVALPVPLFGGAWPQLCHW